MSTPSTIGIKNDNGTITAIYCNYDGYLDSVGLTLYKHYTDTDKMRALLALGDVFSLGAEPIDAITPIMNATGCKYTGELSTKLGDDVYNELMNHYSRAIRDGYNHDARTYDNLDALMQATGTPYAYILDNGKWLVYDFESESPRNFVRFETAVKNELNRINDDERRNDAYTCYRDAGMKIPGLH